MKRFRIQIFCPLAFVLVAMLLVPSAVYGSFPGINGLIAFTRGSEENADIVILDVNGEQTQITNYAGFDGLPSWSLFGDKLLFTSARDGNNEIYVFDARRFLHTCGPHEHPTAQRLTFHPDNDGPAVFSPDGSKIAFQRWRFGESYQIWVMNADGSDQVNISEDATELAPSWSPDGSKIAFSSSRHGPSLNIYVMNPDGSGAVRLTSNDFQDSDPDWSPDGSQIVFTRWADFDNEIYIMNADGSGQANLTNNPFGWDLRPHWSPDGTEIVFQRTTSGESSIYSMSPDGTNVTQLASNGGDPAWGNDSCTDTDEDGIPDYVELLGVRDASGNPVPTTLGLGFPMDPCRKTVAVEIDYMGPDVDGHTHYPLKVLGDGSPNPALQIVMDAFDDAPVEACDCPYEGFPTAPSGVNLVIDISNELPHTVDGYSFGNTYFDEAKSTNFHPARKPYFHYCIWQHSGDQAELTGNDFIVSDVKPFATNWGPPGHPDPDPYCIASVFMQELGHNLGMSHGGPGTREGEWENYKPNYFSAMNYRYQCFQLKLVDGYPPMVIVDYSREALPTLDEAALLEAFGVGPAKYVVAWSGRRTTLGGGAIDWNANGSIDPEPVAFELNAEKKCCLGADPGTCRDCMDGEETQSIPDQMLHGFDDWHNLTYIFTGSGNYADGFHPSVGPEHPHDLHERNHELRAEVLSPPTVIAPEDMVVTSNVPTGATGVELGVPVVSDNDDPDPQVTNDAPNVFPLGSTTVTWTATDFWGNRGTDVQLVTVEPIHVSIDIKPGSGPNTINCGNPNGLITVAILTTEEFDATSVDIASIRFEEAGAVHAAPNTDDTIRHEEDVDKDGDVDLVAHFKLGDTVLSCESVRASLVGTSSYGAIEGSDAVRMVGTNSATGGDGTLDPDEEPRLPATYRLYQNSPNPFNPATRISFDLPVASTYTLAIFDAAGRLVRRYEGSAGAGQTSIEWYATDQRGSRVSSGIYYYKITAGQFTETKKMVLLK